MIIEDEFEFSKPCPPFKESHFDKSAYFPHPRTPLRIRGLSSKVESTNISASPRQDVHYHGWSAQDKERVSFQLLCVESQFKAIHLSDPPIALHEVHSLFSVK